MTDRFNPANKLKGFRSTPVVHEAIRDYDRKKFKEYRQKVGKELLIGGGTLLLGLASVTPIGRAVTGIRKAIKMAGSIGNVKKADTVGNRLRQAQAIMGKKGSELDRLARGPGKTSMFNQRYALKSNTQPVKIGGTRLAPDFANRKIDRTLIQAVEQGPSKFFSSGRSAKTGITPNKRLPGGAQGGTSKGSQMKYDYDTRVDPKDVFGTDVSMSVYHNKSLIKEILKQNKKAREALKKK